jgi:hypothetical protein
MFINDFSPHLSLIIVFIIGSIAFITMFFGFIGNINITSDGGNVVVSGVDLDNELYDQSVEELTVDKEKQLLIDHPVGNITLKAGAADKIVLEKKLYLPKSASEEEKTTAKEIFNRNALSKNAEMITLNMPRIPLANNITAKVDLDVTMPASLGIKQKSGTNDVTVEGITGTVELSVTAGKAHLLNLSGSVDVTVESGSITGNNLQNIGFLIVHAGEISIDNVSVENHDAQVRSSTGSIKLGINKIASGLSCNIASQTGEVELSINRNANIDLKAKSHMGSLEVDPSINLISKEKSMMGGEIKATIGNPEGKLVVSSNVGDISIALE